MSMNETETRNSERPLPVTHPAVLVPMITGYAVLCTMLIGSLMYIIYLRQLLKRPAKYGNSSVGGEAAIVYVEKERPCNCANNLKKGTHLNVTSNLSFPQSGTPSPKLPVNNGLSCEQWSENQEESIYENDRWLDSQENPYENGYENCAFTNLKRYENCDPEPALPLPEERQNGGGREAVESLYADVALPSPTAKLNPWLSEEPNAVKDTYPVLYPSTPNKRPYVNRNAVESIYSDVDLILPKVKRNLIPKWKVLP